MWPTFAYVRLESRRYLKALLWLGTALLVLGIVILGIAVVFFGDDPDIHKVHEMVLYIELTIAAATLAYLGSLVLSAEEVRTQARFVRLRPIGWWKLLVVKSGIHKVFIIGALGISVLLWWLLSQAFGLDVYPHLDEAILFYFILWVILWSFFWTGSVSLIGPGEKHILLPFSLLGVAAALISGLFFYYFRMNAPLTTILFLFPAGSILLSSVAIGIRRWCAVPHRQSRQQFLAALWRYSALLALLLTGYLVGAILWLRVVPSDGQLHNIIAEPNSEAVWLTGGRKGSVEMIQGWNPGHAPSRTMFCRQYYDRRTPLSQEGALIQTNGIWPGETPLRAVTPDLKQQFLVRVPKDARYWYLWYLDFVWDLTGKDAVSYQDGKVYCYAPGSVMREQNVPVEISRDERARLLLKSGPHLWFKTKPYGIADTTHIFIYHWNTATDALSKELSPFRSCGTNWTSRAYFLAGTALYRLRESPTGDSFADWFERVWTAPDSFWFRTVSSNGKYAVADSTKNAKTHLISRDGLRYPLEAGTHWECVFSPDERYLFYIKKSITSGDNLDSLVGLDLSSDPPTRRVLRGWVNHLWNRSLSASRSRVFVPDGDGGLLVWNSRTENFEQVTHFGDLDSLPK